MRQKDNIYFKETPDTYLYIKQSGLLCGFFEDILINKKKEKKAKKRKEKGIKTDTEKQS